MTDAFEKLGLFYLGKHYDAETAKLQDDLLLYESKNLVTHGVCIGMTGSGKTGLCVAALEEAAIDNIPAIIIDPKGDLTNLFLTFPNLTKEEFEPWVNPDEASQKNMSVSDFAQAEADKWRNGLAEWGQSPERIRMFENAAERVLFTPGSSAAIPISILKSFDKPASIDDEELLGERVSTLVSGLLGLLDIEADPLTSREHILISTIIQNEWLAGKNVALDTLILALQDPPIERIGVFDLESYYPKKERFELATKLNNLLASPQFSVWTKGESLNIDRLLYGKNGKPRLSVISIAHLGDKERMFFVTLLLNEMVSWMRQQSGTSSLRAILYMDEIFGYLPPVANPPSKKLFLTLLKQARAFGIGLLLATQNPGDLDYKALGNVGTWFIGRLQTERDKDKVLEGLVTANSGSDKNELSKQLAGLGKRVFMLHSASASKPVLFSTRWVLSYLAGPIMRNRFKELMPENVVTAASETSNNTAAAEPVAAVSTRPMINPEIPQSFIPGGGAVYQPVVLGSANVVYEDRNLGINLTKERNYATPLSSQIVDWNSSEKIEYSLGELENQPREGLAFGTLDTEISSSKLKSWQTDFVMWLYQNKPLEVFQSPALDAVSQEGEDERAFRIRMSHEIRENRDRFVEKIREDYEKEIVQLTRQRERAVAKAETQASQASSHTLGTVISIGSSILGSLFSSRKSFGGVARSASRIGTTMKERKEAAAAEQSVEEIDGRLLELEEEIQQKVNDFQNSDLLEVQKVEILPKKSDINVKLVALGWKPVDQ